MLVSLPALHKALHAIVGTAIAKVLQTFEQSMCGATAGTGKTGFLLQPLDELCFKLAEFGSGRLCPFILGLCDGLEVFAHGGPGKPHVPSNGRDRLILYGMAPANFVNNVHVKHS
jgi:hypothetical protein